MKEKTRKASTLAGICVGFLYLMVGAKTICIELSGIEAVVDSKTLKMASVVVRYFSMVFPLVMTIYLLVTLMPFSRTQHKYMRKLEGEDGALRAQHEDVPQGGDCGSETLKKKAQYCPKDSRAMWHNSLIMAS